MAVRRDRSTDTGRSGPCNPLRSEKGVIIIAVLWICALIMWFALQISSGVRLRGEEQAHIMRRSQSLHLAIGGSFEAIARMGQTSVAGLDEAAEDHWQPDGTPRVVNFLTGQAVVIVEDEQTKVNINIANPQQIKAVLERTGVEGPAAENLADAIADFIDRDDLIRSHGLEKEGYARLGLHYGPFNGPLLSLDQLLLIPGVTHRMFFGYGMKRGDAAENESGIVQQPWMPGQDSLFQLCTVYGKNSLLKEEGLEREVQRKTVPWRNSGVYRILSCGKTAGDASPVVLWLVVRLAPETDSGYEVLYRRIL
ncbi:MAG: hypothetical protein ABFD98_06810 [Syntrophobacteraceae bacterium]|nr:type II secretion system protein GspK [Desulfobacteraceae bacterium]